MLDSSKLALDLAPALKSLLRVQAQHQSLGYAVSSVVLAKTEGLRERRRWELPYREFVIERELELLALRSIGQRVWPDKRMMLSPDMKSAYIDRLMKWQQSSEPIHESINLEALQATIDPNGALYARLKFVYLEDWMSHLAEIRMLRDVEAARFAGENKLNEVGTVTPSKLIAIAHTLVEQRSGCRLIARKGARPAFSCTVDLNAKAALFLRWDDAYLFAKQGDLSLSFGLIGSDDVAALIAADQAPYESMIERCIPGGMYYARDCHQRADRTALAVAAHLDFLLCLRDVCK